MENAIWKTSDKKSPFFSQNEKNRDSILMHGPKAHSYLPDHILYMIIPSCSKLPPKDEENMLIENKNKQGTTRNCPQLSALIMMKSGRKFAVFTYHHTSEGKAVVS